MTKRELVELLAPYGDDEPLVFVTFADGITVHEQAEVAKGHGTTKVHPDGRIDTPVAIYLVDPGQRGEQRRSESFLIEDGQLIRRVVPRPERGAPYTHRCPLAALESVARAIDHAGELGAGGGDGGAYGLSYSAICGRTGLSPTQFSVAMAFLSARGCIGRPRRGRYEIPGGAGSVYDRAMTEYRALLGNPEKEEG